MHFFNTISPCGPQPESDSLIFCSDLQFSYLPATSLAIGTLRNTPPPPKAWDPCRWTLFTSSEKVPMYIGKVWPYSSNLSRSAFTEGKKVSSSQVPSHFLFCLSGW